MYRLTLSHGLLRFWERCKIWCCRTASPIVYIPAAVYHYLTVLWLAQFANINDRTDVEFAPSEAETSVAVDANERPILTGVAAADCLDKVE